MSLSRREFSSLVGMAGLAGILPLSKQSRASYSAELGAYHVPNYGSVRLLHMTDCHAQLLPIYFREPSVNLGIGAAKGQPPHLVGNQLLNNLDRKLDAASQHAFTYLNFVEAAKTYGKVGGFAHLKTLVDRLRQQYGDTRTLLLDGGDTWQGSGTAYWTRGRDMVEASNLLGVDIMTGHWEFTYQDKEVRDNIKHFNGEFLAQNVKVEEEALFDGAEAFDEESGHAFKPYSIRKMGDHRVAVIGQAFPYTPIANPKRFVPEWEFGINDGDLQELINEVRQTEKPDAVVLLSHNGMDVDLKLASRVSGIDAILGGHTHDGIPEPLIIENSGGKTLVTNAGSNGKFLGVLDLKITSGRVSGFQYRLLPIFSNLLAADQKMQEYIDRVRAPYLDRLTPVLGHTQGLLYRRGNFNGTYDQLICDAQRTVGDAQISLSPGFRWGTSLLPGAPITMESLLDQTCITYPETYVRNMTGSEIKLILEDVCDNLFNPDPYYQQGGDMVRVGGLNYTCDPTRSIGGRISELTLDSGKQLESSKSYRVAGWATTGSQSTGRPIWDVVAEYIRDQGEVSISTLNSPKLLNVARNPGLVQPGSGNT